MQKTAPKGPDRTKARSGSIAPCVHTGACTHKAALGESTQISGEVGQQSSPGPLDGQGEEPQVKRMSTQQHPVGQGGAPLTPQKHPYLPPPQASLEPMTWLFPLGVLSTQAVGGHVTGIRRADPSIPETVMGMCHPTLALQRGEAQCCPALSRHCIDSVAMPGRAGFDTLSLVEEAGLGVLGSRWRRSEGRAPYGTS